MKKSSFISLLLGTISGVLFALGVCMVLIPEWDSFRPGIAFGCTGILCALLTIGIRRRMENREPVRLTRRTVLTAFIAIAGALALGTGMCFSMVWDRMITGILVGLAGICALLSLIPLTKGIHG